VVFQLTYKIPMMVNNYEWYGRRYFIWFCVSIFLLAGCNKLLQVAPPVNTIPTSEVFQNDQQATEAATGMYAGMINISLDNFASGGITLYGGMSADELIPFDQAFNDGLEQFQEDNILTNNNALAFGLWNPAYSTIYDANALLTGLASGTGIHDSVKNELTGEAEFVRAFCNFYLVNLWGQVPLVTSVNWQKTNLLSSSSTADIYAAIVSDLEDARARLAVDYSVGGGQRIVPNKWAAEALLARVFLFTGEYDSASYYAGDVIAQSGTYSLVSDLNGIFLINSTEAIWQLQQSNLTFPFNATPDGFRFIPLQLNSYYVPFAYLTPTLLNAFDPGDNRVAAWIDSTNYSGTELYFPYKYKVGPAEAAAGAPYTEYYMVLRLGEQYLIRAEGEARGSGGVTAAVTDLNTIRNRAGLPGYTGSMSQDSVLAAIIHERQVELFAEWGARWFDLKRIGQAAAVLSAEKGRTVDPYELLYPIPNEDILKDPNLRQNPGYPQ
jgi:hypothetical protein